MVPKSLNKKPKCFLVEPAAHMFLGLLIIIRLLLGTIHVLLRFLYLQ